MCSPTCCMPRLGVLPFMTFKNSSTSADSFCSSNGCNSWRVCCTSTLKTSWSTMFAREWKRYFKWPLQLSNPNAECVQSGPQSLTYLGRWISKWAFAVQLLSPYSSGSKVVKSRNISSAALICVVERHSWRRMDWTNKLVAKWWKHSEGKPAVMARNKKAASHRAPSTLHVAR